MSDFSIRAYDPSPRGYSVGRVGGHEWYIGWNRTRFSIRIRSVTYRSDLSIQMSGDPNRFPSRDTVEAVVKFVSSQVPLLEQKAEHFLGGLVSTSYLVEYGEDWEVFSVRGNFSDYKWILSTVDRRIEIVDLGVQSHYFHSPISQLVRLERICRICKIHEQ